MTLEEQTAQRQMRKEKAKFEKQQNKIKKKSQKYRKPRKDKHITKKIKEAINKGVQRKL